MFQQARLKLTAWYLLIIMIISLMFSFAIYKVLTAELNRFSKLQQLRLEQRLEQKIIIAPGSRPSGPGFLAAFAADPELVAEVHRRIFFFLLMVNGGILLVAGWFGYVLAGKTLQPIQTMVDEQNQFVSDASHELKTPLTALKTSLEVHRRDKKLSMVSARKLIDGSLEEVAKLQSLTDGLLKLARFEESGSRPHFSRVPLSEVLKHSIQKIGPVAREKDITFVNESGDFFVKGERYALTDLFVILLDNAVKYSSQKSTVELKAAREDNFVVISVTDHGIGVRKQDLPHIFDRFYRSDSARSKSGTGGYGLGLSIAQKIVAAHHGAIAVNSKPGKGSTFIVRLPLFS